MAAFLCSQCGAPLDPEPNAVRATCRHCGTVTAVVSEQAHKLGKQLQALGIRIPERPMTQEDIAEDLERRARVEREKRRTALIVCAVLVPLFLAFLVGLIAMSQPR